MRVMSRLRERMGRDMGCGGAGELPPLLKSPKLTAKF